MSDRFEKGDKLAGTVTCGEFLDQLTNRWVAFQTGLCVKELAIANSITLIYLYVCRCLIIPECKDMKCDTIIEFYQMLSVP